MSQQEYSASTNLCRIFEKILSEVYSKQEVSPTVLQHVSRHHRECASHFREGLQCYITNSPNPELWKDLSKQRFPGSQELREPA